MKLNEYRLAMVIRWRKLYGIRNRTKLNRTDRIEAMVSLSAYLAGKGRNQVENRVNRC